MPKPMCLLIPKLLCLFSLALAFASPVTSAQTTVRSGPYLGLDKNGYPGDDLLPALHKTFTFTGYWLNNPPGTAANPWAGKRATLRKAGFGFAILFNGRLYADLKSKDAAALGRADAATAVSAANREGFPAQAILFLDQEEGGHLLPEQSAYVFAWIDAIRKSAYRPGVYASGIRVTSGAQQISTAGEIAAHDPDVKLWIANDQCPPAPGCVVPQRLPSPALSEFPAAAVWQYSQSPRRARFTAQCASTYDLDNNCYAPGLPHSPATFLDLNTANSPNPSRGR